MNDKEKVLKLELGKHLTAEEISILQAVLVTGGGFLV